jgi:hypothetical protein
MKSTSNDNQYVQQLWTRKRPTLKHVTVWNRLIRPIIDAIRTLIWDELETNEMISIENISIEKVKKKEKEKKNKLTMSYFS